MRERPNIFSLFSKRTALWILLVSCLGVFLILWDGKSGESVSGAENRKEQESYYSVRFYTENLEERIASLCRQVKGITEAHVLLTLDGGTESVFAENRSSSAYDYVIIEGASGSEPVLIREIYPQIRGVAVVCTKGNDSEVQRTVTELLAAALGISSSRIRVAGS